MMWSKNAFLTFCMIHLNVLTGYSTDENDIAVFIMFLESASFPRSVLGLCFPHCRVSFIIAVDGLNFYQFTSFLLYFWSYISISLKET